MDKAVMTTNASDEVLKATTKCKHKFSCVETSKCGEDVLCGVNRRIGKQLLALKGKANTSCPYWMSFGGHDICRCPVHYELYTQRER